jgi:hypothetical protein
MIMEGSYDHGSTREAFDLENTVIKRVHSLLVQILASAFAAEDEIVEP